MRKKVKNRNKNSLFRQPKYYKWQVQSVSKGKSVSFEVVATSMQEVLMMMGVMPYASTLKPYVITPVCEITALSDLNLELAALYMQVDGKNTAESFDSFCRLKGVLPNSSSRKTFNKCRSMYNQALKLGVSLEELKKYY